MSTILWINQIDSGRAGTAGASRRQIRSIDRSHEGHTFPHAEFGLPLGGSVLVSLAGLAAIAILLRRYYPAFA